ncbi:MAG: DASS family sodium-coupled anion symporter [Vicingaceae bacterium]
MSLVQKIAFFLGPLGWIICLYANEFYEESKLTVMAGIAFWMMIWWISEVVPIFVTALLPMVLFPALNILPIKETFEPFANPIIFLFMGGFIIALAMEKRKLHLRIALNLIKITGTEPSGIILGFILATAFLSMWISNTATTVMMLPIAMSVLQLLNQKEAGKEYKKFGLALMLSIAYAANIGGTMTLIGTPPNVVFAGFLLERYQIEIGFGQWMLIGLPFGIIMLGLTFLLLTRGLIVIRLPNIEGAKQLISNELMALGRMEKAEKMVLTIFVLTASLWMFKSQVNSLVFGGPILNNTSIAMLGGLLMFCLPVNMNSGEFLLDWKAMKDLPWGILLLFGGGLSMAAGLETVGAIDLIATAVSDNLNATVLIMLIGLTTLSLFATEIMSNVALVTVLLPVIMGISDQMGVSVYQFAIPVTLAASCAFMMPISTPPNAVVFSSGQIKIEQMIRVGFALNIATIAVLSTLVYWLISKVFGE